MGRQEGTRRDIFDRIMSLPLLRRAYPFYAAHKEVLLYLFFGAVTTAVSLGSFYLFESVLGLDPLLANPISWVLAVLVAYLTNRVWVFHSAAHGAGAILLEVTAFFAGRVVTLLVEEAILLLFVTWLALPAFPVKVAASVIVVILNYILSKLVVFRKGKPTETDEA